MTTVITVPVPIQLIQQDPEYDFVAPAVPARTKRGRQCGLCGAKFDYGVGYGYCCTWIDCPMGFGAMSNAS